MMHAFCVTLPVRGRSMGDSGTGFRVIGRWWPSACPRWGIAARELGMASGSAGQKRAIHKEPVGRRPCGRRPGKGVRAFHAVGGLAAVSADVSPPPFSGRGHPRLEDSRRDADLRLRTVVSGRTLEDTRADLDSPRDELPDYVECAVAQRPSNLTPSAGTLARGPPGDSPFGR